MALYGSYYWKKIPFLKLLLPFMGGIITAWYLQPPLRLWLLLLLSGLTSLAVFFFIPLLTRFRFSFLSGLASTLVLFSLGAVLTWQKDIRHHPRWLGNNHGSGDAWVLALDESPVEKAKSFKAIARVLYRVNDSGRVAADGRLILYFKKDSCIKQLEYGSILLLKKPVQEIKSTGNPGGFDFKQYSFFQGITHQVYLQPHEFEILPGKKGSWLKKQVIASGKNIVSILRRYIPGEKEAGLAEALLIGYKDDLDPALVQAYTNTGVVHIIAISGLHLGLIYWLLTLLLKPLLRSQKTKWLHPLLVISGLWAFSFLAGAQPSVLRSALMFSCIVIGETFSRRTSVLNTLAVSAFLLLCYSPFWLWDVGFQLSYSAVLSILLFRQPVYNWFYIKNKLLDAFWKLNAVTLSAQVLTLPFSIYHFHQFPASFILTNFLAVPLSSAILLAEIFLCMISFFPWLAVLSGKIISFLIWFMNAWVERAGQLPFLLWENLQLSMTQGISLMLLLVTASYWLLEKSKPAFFAALTALLCFAMERSVSFIQASRQEKIIVYNLPQKKGLDLIRGRAFVFTGDSDLQEDGFARNFHLKPARILNRVSETGRLDGLTRYENYIRFSGRNILLIDEPVSFLAPPENRKPVVDLLILSGHPELDLPGLAAALDIRQVVLDGSVPAWKALYWKKEGDSLRIPCHDVSVNGAFVMTLN